MRFPRRSVCLVGFGLALASTADALEWSVTAVDLSAKEGMGTVEAQFFFRNDGPKPVTILSLKSSCNCTTATVGKSRVGPGETGEIRGTVNLEHRVGRQIKTITVATGEPDAKPTVLRINLLIAPALTIEPQMLTWRARGLPTAQAVEFHLASGESGELREAHSSDSTFALETQLAADRRSGRVIVTPKDTSRPHQAQMVLSTTIAGEPRVYGIFLQVK